MSEVQAANRSEGYGLEEAKAAWAGTLGALSEEEMDRVQAAVALILDIEPSHCS